MMMMMMMMMMMIIIIIIIIINESNDCVFEQSKNLYPGSASFHPGIELVTRANSGDLRSKFYLGRLSY